jgi:hypothetical protein
MSCRWVLALVVACVAASVDPIPLEETSPVHLGTAESYVILAKSGISTVPRSVITGDIAVSPITGEAMTGFALEFGDTTAYKVDRSLQLTGKAYAASFTAPSPGDLTTAVLDMETAYTDAAGRPNPDAARINLGGGLLGGDFGGPTAPLTAGVYTFGSDVSILSDLHFAGDSSSVFIIQVTGNVVQAANYAMILGGQVESKNIFWQVAGYVLFGAGAHAEGIMLAKTKAVFETGSSLNGRILTQTACTLQMATIAQPAKQTVPPTRYPKKKPVVPSSYPTFPPKKPVVPSSYPTFPPN